VKEIPEPGKFYLFACPWDWTHVAEYVCPINSHQHVVKNCGYFTRTGATFDILVTKGLQPNSEFHPTPGGPEEIIASPFNKVMPWLANTPWVKENNK
jgi:hypothetical protein